MNKLASTLIVLAALSTAHAKPKAKGNVKAHMDRAAKAHKDGKFEVALAELKAAYEIEPQPKLIYAIAQVHAKLDHCEEAIEHYERFLAADNDKAKETVVRQAIDACKKKLADKPDKGDGVFRAKKDGETAEVKPVEASAVNREASAEPAPPPVETRPVPPPPPVEPPPAPPPAAAAPARSEPPPAVVMTTRSTHSPWYRDVLGDALVVTGVGATVASVFLYRAAQSDLDNAEAATTLAGYNDYRSNAESKQLYTYVLAGGGIALVTAGVLRFALRDNQRETRSVAIVPSGDGGLITFSGGF